MGKITRMIGKRIHYLKQIKKGYVLLPLYVVDEIIFLERLLEMIKEYEEVHEV